MLNSSQQPLVSIIIPAYNCAKYIRQSINSILSQNYKNLEILISDDCSIDETRSIIDSYKDPRIKRFHNEKNLGNILTTINLFSKSNGKLITFQDADDWSHHSRIQKQVSFMLESLEIDFSCTGYSRVKENGDPIIDIVPAATHREVIDQISEEHHPRLCYATLMGYRDQIVEGGGTYREEFAGLGGADVDFLYRMLDSNTIKNLPDILYYYRITEGSISNKINLNQYTTLFVGPQLAYFLRKQRISSGKDSIQERDLSTFNDIKLSIEEKYKDNDHKVYSHIAPRWASLGCFKNLIYVTKQYYRAKPFSLTTYINSMIAFIRYFLGDHYYKYLSSKLNFLKKIYKKITV